MMYTRAYIIFKGKVQGVFFRANTERRAIELNLTGWVRNLRDGSVEAMIEGPKETINELIEWCKKHQPHAVIEDVNIIWKEYMNEFDNFEIKY